MEWIIQPIFEVMKCCGGPTCKYIDGHRKFKEHMFELRRKVDALKSREQDVESRNEAELRCRKVVKKEVENWLKDVQRVKTDMEEIEKKFGDVSYFLRGQLGKMICQKIEEVKEIYEQGSFPDGVAIDGPPATGLTLPTPNLEGEVDGQERIWEYLMGDEVGMIGVCGMGGIGKTTIMKHINNRLLEESKKFDHVIWVTVSKDLNIFKLQKVIADSLKEYLPKDELQQRGATLKHILEGKRYVLILDDVWERFSLLDVGILEATLNVGRKVVLTSRSVDVCKSMGCEVVKVQPLSKESSMKLFLDHVGHTILQDENLKYIVKNIVEQCGGLPLSIVTIAGSMKGVHDICEWRNALIELEKRVKSVKGLDIEIFERLKFSYDRLEEPKIQNCFLYCSLYSEDYVIRKEKLIESWIDEGLLEGLETRQAMHYRGHSILNKLENNCLLDRAVGDFQKEGVKMHDVLRDMALYIKGHHFMVKAGMHVPSEQEWAVSVEKVSLMENRISEIPPHISPKCPHLTTLILKECGLRSISESFFKHMPELKVLDLSGNYEIVDLPKSIFHLKTLNALILHGCWMLKYMPSLAELGALRKLDLGGTAIKEVPHGIEMLENLIYLDLSSWELKEIPVGILKVFSHIQCLLLKGVYAMGEEVGKLKKLEYVRCSFCDMLEFENYAKFVLRKWPTIFIFEVGSFEYYYGQGAVVNFREVEKMLRFGKCEMERWDEIMVPHDLRCLYIEHCDDFKCLVSIPLFGKATKLKKCQIVRCSGVECVVDVLSWSCNALHTIDVLSLEDLENMHEVVRGGVGFELESTSHPPSPLAFFSSLKQLVLDKCPKVKKLFPVELLPVLHNLEKIYVSHCEEMEEIIGTQENHKGQGTIFFLPKLKSLSLYKLPKLKSICGGFVKVVGVAEGVELESTSHAPSPPAFLSSLRDLILYKCPRVKKLFPVELLQGLQNLEVIDVSVCEEIEEIVASEEYHKGQGTTCILPKLKSLILSECPRVKKLLPVELFHCLQNLEKIEVRYCQKMEEIIASENNHKREGTTLILSKLKLLNLFGLPKLKSICSGGVMISSDSLQLLRIEECQQVKRIPLCLPLVENGQPCAPPSLKRIIVSSREWWESVEWDQPDVKHVLSPFVR